LDDYSTYPYVNLGNLVLDGIGKQDDATEYNFDATTTRSSVGGYTYSIVTYQNDGVYFTRTELPEAQSAVKKVYCVADDTSGAQGYNAISANASVNALCSMPAPMKRL
jgi:hypothetical protein